MKLTWTGITGTDEDTSMIVGKRECAGYNGGSRLGLVAESENRLGL